MMRKRKEVEVKKQRQRDRQTELREEYELHGRKIVASELKKENISLFSFDK